MSRPLLAPPPPTPLQALLLRAVTRPAAEAVPAWRVWHSAVAVDDLEPDSQWLLPRLYTQLSAAGVPPSALTRYASVYRHNWYKNQLRLRALRATDSAWVLIGGAALAAAYYPLLGERPFAAPAVTTAWTGATRALNWHGQPLRVPAAADLLVQVLAGAWSADDLSQLLWVVDAVVLSDHLPVEGWAAVWRRAAALDLTPIVQARLGWLHAAGVLVDAPVPA